MPLAPDIFPPDTAHLSRRRLFGALGVMVVVVAVTAVVGGVYGYRIGSAASVANINAVEGQVRELRLVLDVVESNYADPVRPADLIYEGAIPSMLRSLDPHSMFFDPARYGRLREEQRGQYAGVGMLIRPYYGETIVDYPFPGTPAFAAGIRPGDVIVKIDGVSTDGLDVEEVAQRVRGPEGTTVHLSLRRPGSTDLVEAEVIRAGIPRPSVPLAFLVAPRVAYIKINTFNETTGEELDEALERIEREKLKGLVLDLRGNQGGLLTGGVRVADHFLQPGQTIVSHRGRSSDERVYKARQGQKGDAYPMVVLVNCSSASASEIVAGALQDHDRALIAGAHTFGKGLVQSVFDLSDSAGLVLTTARYYTPSGRLIQRPYDNVSQRDYYAGPCSDDYEPANHDPRLTDKGRAVYSGVGISPDVKIPEMMYNAFQRRLLERRAFEGFAQQFSLQNGALPPGWKPSPEIVSRFGLYLEEQEIPFTPTEFKQDLPHIERMLQRSILTAMVDFDEATRADAELDPAVRRAVELLPEARALLRGESGSVSRNLP
jgi:carboxyl-terminal processing protease